MIDNEMKHKFVLAVFITILLFTPFARVFFPRTPVASSTSPSTTYKDLFWQFLDRKMGGSGVGLIPDYAQVVVDAVADVFYGFVVAVWVE